MLQDRSKIVVETLTAQYRPRLVFWLKITEDIVPYLIWEGQDVGTRESRRWVAAKAHDGLDFWQTELPGSQIC